MENKFAELLKLNVNDKVEKKQGLAYLSWAFAWGELKKVYPAASMTTYENQDGWNYHTDGRTCWVKVGITIDGAETIEYLPVMDNRNRAIPLDAVTSFDVNKAIQRARVKAIAEATGIGLYIYAGEDLPEQDEPAEKPAEKPKAVKKPAAKKPEDEPLPTASEIKGFKPNYFSCSECGGVIADTTAKDGSVMDALSVVEFSKGTFGRPLCSGCMRKINAMKKLKGE